MASRAKRKAAPTISGPGFNNPRDPTLTELKRLVAPSFERAQEELLPNLANWSGGLYGAIGLNLANDNRSVESGCFLLYGQLSNTPISAQCAKFWPRGNDLKLELRFEDMSIFNFKDSLTSDLLDSAAINHIFTRGDTQIERAELEDAGINGFCIKAFITPTRETFAKIHLALLPMGLDELLDAHPLADNPLFPVISLTTPGEFPIGPAAAGVRLPDPWGFPIWPILTTTTNLNDVPNVPSGTDLRAAMAAILRKATRAEAKNGPAALLRRWDEVKEAGASNLKGTDPDKRWPLPKPSPPRG